MLESLSIFITFPLISYLVIRNWLNQASYLASILSFFFVFFFFFLWINMQQTGNDTEKNILNMEKRKKRKIAEHAIIWMQKRCCIYKSVKQNLCLVPFITTTSGINDPIFLWFLLLCTFYFPGLIPGQKFCYSRKHCPIELSNILINAKIL